jgi:hypothetical protein
MSIRKEKKYFKNNEMAWINTHLSIWTKKNNGLNPPIKRHKLAGYVYKANPAICCLQKMYLTDKDPHTGLKWKDGKRFKANKASNSRSSYTHA